MVEPMKPNDPHKHLDTSQRIKHVFACQGWQVHVMPGFVVLRTVDFRCPHCGATVTDITDTPLGMAYFAFTRPDLGKRP